MITHYFGTDPECFIYTHFVDTKYGSIPYIIPPAALVEDYNYNVQLNNDKKVLYLGDDFQWSEDGAAIELQVAPSNTVEMFVERKQRAYQELREFISKDGFKLWEYPLAFFDLDKFWKGRGENFRTCVLFGCDPDKTPEEYKEYEANYNLYSPELDVSQHSYRYGGGHFHVQAPLLNPFLYFENWEMSAILFDFFGGLLNTSFDRDNSVIVAEKARLEYFGKPGRIRLQKYDVEKEIFGFEYRVLSNYVLTDNEKISKMLVSLDAAATIVEEDLLEEFSQDNFYKVLNVYSCILNLDKESSKDLYKDVVYWAESHGVIDNKVVKFLLGDKNA